MFYFGTVLHALWLIYAGPDFPKIMLSVGRGILFILTLFKIKCFNQITHHAQEGYPNKVGMAELVGILKAYPDPGDSVLAV
jgi:hypothetical protein